MRHVIAVWAKSGDSSFERNVPLEFLGERNRRLGSRVSFDVLFLEGLNLLSEGYRDKLSALGFRLHDMESSHLKAKSKYSLLARFGDYERNCFLRWLAIRDFCGKSPLVHYDADIVFNATPDEIEADFAGLTFILQGCPAYARLEDSSWLVSYGLELDQFVADIESYSADAWQQRSAFAATFQGRNGSLWDRRILSSDQDLMQFLTLSGRLPQADAATVNGRCSSLLFQNPISIGADIHLPLPLQYGRRDGIDYIGERKIAFWHMQSDFCNYLGYATFLHLLGSRRRVPWVRGERPLSYLTYRALARLNPAYSRGGLIRRYFSDHEDLGFLLNDVRFWQERVFA